jgi:hypothetical protein
MRKDTMLIILGLVIALMPFVGIPNSWKMAIVIALGIGVMLTALSLRHYLTRVSERLSQYSKTQEQKSSPVYVETPTHIPSPVPTSVGYESTIIKPRRSRRIKQVV